MWGKKEIQQNNLDNEHEVISGCGNRTGDKEYKPFNMKVDEQTVGFFWQISG